MLFIIVKEHDLHIEFKSYRFSAQSRVRISFLLSMPFIIVKEHDLHIEFKSYKFKLLGKLVV